MPLYNLNESPLLRESQMGSRRFTPLGHILLFFAVFYVSALVESLLLWFPLVFTSMELIRELVLAVFAGDLEHYTEIMSKLISSREFLLSSLLVTAVTIGAIILLVKVVEKRSLASIGLRSRHAIRLYLIGLLLGGLLFAGAVGICTWNGALALSPAESVSIPWLIAFFVGFVIQGASEEILLRGYFMMSFTAGRKNPIFAIIISSVLFAFLHSENAGFGLLPFINILLFGIVASVLMLRTNSIVPSLALHTAWNFAEGCIFGTSVSGLSAMPSVFVGVMNDGKVLTNGGAFGPEGGLAVTAVLIVALMIVTFIPSNQTSEKPKAENGTLAA